MTHDRCSELLPGYVRAELPREQADDVRAHLAGCADCRAEERAVAAVARSAAPDARPLDDLERARLHRGLAQELFTPRTGAAGATPEARTWKRWIVPAATAAAVLAGVAVMTLGGGADSESEVAQLSAEQGGADSGAAEAEGRDSVEDSTKTEEKAGNKPGTQRASEGFAAAAGAEAELGAPAEPTPAFFPALGVLTPADLSEIGRGHLFQSFVDAYGPADGPGLYRRFLDAIAEEAVGIGPEIEECASTLPQDGSLIPAYGALAEYRGERVLVLGFVTRDEDSRRLNRSLLSVWERERCEQPVDTLSQEIDRR